jgi:sporulation protein YlmC with PRC-barrel domain
MRKLLLGGLLATTLVVPAFAEEWRASKLIGLNVYNDQNEKLGDISEILMDKSGKVDGVVIGVGGFLGVGRHDIKVELSKLKFVDEPVRTSSTTSSGTTGSGAALRQVVRRPSRQRRRKANGILTTPSLAARPRMPLRACRSSNSTSRATGNNQGPD